jgi:soluble lytic murein transglycosylase
MVRIHSGDHALYNGDWDSALREYQAAQQSSPDPEIQAVALLGIGRAYFYAGDYARALDALRLLVDSYPDSPVRPDAYFFLGQIYGRLARYSEAAQAYLSYLAQRPGVIDAYVLEWRGDALFAAGDYAGALTDYLASLQSPQRGTGIPVQIKAAQTYAITGDYATAILMYQDIYGHATDDYLKARVDYLLGQTYATIGQSDQAYAVYLDAVQNYPLAYESYLGLVELVNAGYPVDELDRGLVDYYAGQYDVAWAAFDRYLAANPVDPATAYYYKGLSLSALTNYSGAIDQWDAVIQDYSASDVWDNAWEMKAYTYWFYLNRYTEAIQTLVGFVDAVSWHPRAAEFLFDAGRVAERANNLDRAATLWERVVNEYPGSEYAYNSLFQAGICRYRLGDYTEAFEIFQRLLGISANLSQRSTAYFWIAKSQDAQGDAAGARANWEQAAASDPTGYYSERARDILVGNAPFTPPPVFDLAFDLVAERADAEAWLRTTFFLAEGTDLSYPGPLANDPRLQRGAELWRLGLYSLARDEFEDLRQLVASDAANSYRLANYFFDIGLYRSAILAARQVLTLAGMDDAATLNAPAYFNHLRFGPYIADLLIPAAHEHTLHPLLLFAMVRQESLFESFINSSAGARGLMQIIPATGQGIADQLGWPPNYTTDDLYRPLVSVIFGTEYLDNQRTYLGGNIYAALAAYNGGPGNASEWRSMAGDDPDLFLEVIRFDESRRYIQRIYEIFAIYRRLYARAP